MYATARSSESGGVLMAMSSGLQSVRPSTAIATEMPVKKVALVPTTRLVLGMLLAPMYWPTRIVAASATPKAAPIRRNITVLALEVAVSAASPRKRPTHTEFTEPFRDCSTLANRIGRANLYSVTGIDPSVSARCTLLPGAGESCEYARGEQRP